MDKFKNLFCFNWLNLNFRSWQVAAKAVDELRITCPQRRFFEFIPKPLTSHAQACPQADVAAGDIGDMGMEPRIVA